MTVSIIPFVLPNGKGLIKKDINKFKSHDDFIDRITNIQNDQPISDKETKYDHPDNNVIYNND